MFQTLQYFVVRLAVEGLEHEHAVALQGRLAEIDGRVREFRSARLVDVCDADRFAATSERMTSATAP